MKRIFALLLALSLLLTSCGPAVTTESTPPDASAGQVARTVLAACEPVETEQITGDALTLWLTEFYGLPEDSWTDCALYRAANSMLAFEIAVIQLSQSADPAALSHCLDRYRLDRQGDFTGYEPEQAAIVEHSLTALSHNERFLALLICEDTGPAKSAFYAAADDGLFSSPAPAATPAPDPTESPSPVVLVPPDPDPMAIYDTSAILAAWNSGDDSALTPYDRTILNRCREVLADILTDGMSDYEKEKAIYQWVTRHVDYDYDHYNKLEGASINSSTPYNPLTEGKGICMGFASTFQLLADLAGLESIIVPGKAFNGREDHAWNMIRLDGQWYCLDATWDESALHPSSWSYFNVTSQYMSDTNHQWDYDAFPTATATDGGKP